MFIFLTLQAMLTKIKVIHAGTFSSPQQVETYLVGSSRYPLVVHGHSGCGKTSVMAVAAQRAWELYKGKAIVILR